MTNHSTERRSSAEQFLDQLLDALAERQAVRNCAQGRPEPPARPVAPATPDTPLAARPIEPGHKSAQPATAGERPSCGDGALPPRVPSMQLDRALGRLIAAVALLVIAVNVPLNRHGASLARILPDSASLIVREGMILKGGGPEIYMLQHDELCWISSIDAFEHLGLEWRDVHVVEDGFLARFKEGRPIHVLLKCEDSPHIYRLEGGHKRWIKDIGTLLAEGHVWEDVRTVSCEYLRNIPDGPSIPEDAGPPPQP